MVKFTGCYVTGLNISEYQLKHAEMYSKRVGLSHKLKFIQGDFMVGRTYFLIFAEFSAHCVFLMLSTAHD